MIPRFDVYNYMYVDEKVDVPWALYGGEPAWVEDGELYSLEIYGSINEQDGYTAIMVYDGCGSKHAMIFKDENKVDDLEPYLSGYDDYDDYYPYCDEEE